MRLLYSNAVVVADSVTNDCSEVIQFECHFDLLKYSHYTRLHYVRANTLYTIQNHQEITVDVLVKY